MAKRICRDVFVISEVARAIFGIIFKNQGSYWTFVDCGLISKKLRGLFAKFLK
jgi:hypothetical protein